MLNLILDMPDTATAIGILEAVFMEKLKSVINLDQIDIPKEQLKKLLKIQTLKLMSHSDEIADLIGKMNAEQDKKLTKSEKLEKQKLLKKQFFSEEGLREDDLQIVEFKYFEEDDESIEIINDENLMKSAGASDSDSGFVVLKSD